MGLVFLAVLLGPILLKPIEQNLEIFFLGAGALASALARKWGKELLHAALTAPIALTLAVLVFGTIAKLVRPLLDREVERLVKVVKPKWIYFGMIIGLGLLSSIITAVIAALILVEAVALLKLDRRSEVSAVVLACFAIGLGAGLTPVGEPLGTITIVSLKADFWYLTRLLGPLIGAGIVLVGSLSLFLPAKYGHSLRAELHTEGLREIGTRAAKVYLFVAGLVGLSWGLRPVVDEYITRLPQWALFWLNSISAVVDNATLAAAEIGPALTRPQQRGVLMGLLISGGMLIPGNIPNIVAAGRLGISSREWARVGLAAGLPLMLICFGALRWLS